MRSPCPDPTAPLAVTCGSEDSGGQMKEQLADDAELDPSRLLIMFCGKRITDRVPIVELGLRPSDVLQAFVLPRPIP